MGTMYSASSAATKSVTVAESTVLPVSATTYPTIRGDAPSVRTSATEAATPGGQRSIAASISPSSMRKPRTFTWKSLRPTYSNCPRVVPPRQVPRSDTFDPPRTTEWIGKEPHRSQCGFPEVSPPSHLITGDVHFADDTWWYQVQSPIEYVDGQSRYCSPDDARRRVLAVVAVECDSTDVHCRLGDPVHVDQRRGPCRAACRTTCATARGRALRHRRRRNAVQGRDPCRSVSTHGRLRRVGRRRWAFGSGPSLAHGGAVRGTCPVIWSCSSRRRPAGPPV